MGFEVIGRSGAYEHYTIRDWPSIIGVIQAVKYPMPRSWNNTDSPGLPNQLACNLLAEQIEEFLNSEQELLVPQQTDHGAMINAFFDSMTDKEKIKFCKKIVKKRGTNSRGSVVITPNDIPKKFRESFSPEVDRVPFRRKTLRNFVAFLRICDGFDIR